MSDHDRTTQPPLAPAARPRYISAGPRDEHPNLVDPTFSGRYLRCLPDMTLVPIDRYEEARKAYQKRVEREKRLRSDGD